MKNTKSCPKCGSTDIVRIPDNPNRHASGNNIYTSTYTLFGKIPVERQVMPSLLMIKEIEKQTGANYLEEIDRHTRLTEKQELKIKQMTTDIADMIEKDTAVPQGNDGIF